MKVEALDEESADEQFARVLNGMLDLLSDEMTPSVRAFIRGVRARYVALREEGREGLNAEYLVSDLVGILRDFEIRLRDLEKRADRGLDGP